MGEKFKDFPCLYYLNNRINRKNKIQFYAMLASMFGLTPEQAAQTSELFAHASGKLFDGTGIPLEDIMREAENYFVKPYKDCRGFYRRKAFDEAALKENCCIICPYSHSYMNNNLEHERQILHVLIEHRDWFSIAGCSTGDFQSRLALSCTNDISEYPVIPFNAYFFEYLMRNDVLKEKKVTEFVRDALGEHGQFVPESVLSPFVSLQLGIISRTVLVGGDDTSSLIFAVNALRETHYVPPQLVHPASITPTKAGKKGRSSSNAIHELARLFQDFDNMHFVKDSSLDSAQKLPETNAAPQESPSAATEQGSVHTTDDETHDTAVPTSEAEDSIEAFGKLLEALSQGSTGFNDLINDNADTSIRDGNDSKAEKDHKEDPVEETTNESDIVLEVQETDEEEFPIFPETEYENMSVKGNIPPLENRTEDTVTLEEPLEEPLNESEIEPDVPDMPLDESEPEIHPCAFCHGVSPEEYHFADEWQRAFYQHCISCENAMMNEQEKPYCSSVMNHPVVATGCAFSSGSCDTNCVYSDAPTCLSAEFIEHIKDCSDYAGNLANLIAFIEVCSDATSMAVECVQMYGIDGLLFYVSGSYYFIGGGTTAHAALKQLFSDASKLVLYSMNPILVHVNLLRFGLRHIKVESLAVLYSVFAGTDLLLPPGVFFVIEKKVDMYRSIMPQYAKLFDRIVLTDDEKKRYEKLKRLEWGLASSVDNSFIAFGANRSVYGSNALNYRFALLDAERICRKGVLYVVTLDRESELPPEEARLFWEDVAGRLAASSLSCMNYAFILGLGNGISYFACFEEDAFFDSLMASARSAYKKAYKKEVHLQVVCERYVEY